MEKDMVTLVVENPERSDPVAPLRWCLNNEERGKVERALSGKKWIAVIISVVKDGVEVNRKVVDVNQLMEYVEFFTSGIHTIHLLLCMGHYEQDAFGNETLGSFIKRWSGRRADRTYKYSLYDSDGSLDTSALEGIERKVMSLESIDINVADGHFGKKPPEWLQKLLLSFYDERAEDPCETRRQILLLPFIVMFMIIFYGVCVPIRFLWGIGNIVWGTRGVKIQNSWNLKDTDVYTVVPSSHSERANRFLVDENGYLRSLWFLLLHPLSLSGGLYLSYIIYKYNLSIQKFLSEYGMIVLTVLLVCGLIAFIAWFVKADSQYKRRKRKRNKKREAKRAEDELRKEREKKEAERRAQETASLLSCESGSRPTVSDLPKGRRTIYLRFRELKTRVCRPYAR